VPGEQLDAWAALDRLALIAQALITANTERIDTLCQLLTVDAAVAET
jgi:hypothetical protein